MITPEIEKKYLNIQANCVSADQINANLIAVWILDLERIITFEDTQEIYCYIPEKGIYEKGENYLKSVIQFCCVHKTNTHLVSEVLNSIKRRTYVRRDSIGKEKNLIPLNNGIYDIVEKKLMPLTPDVIFLSKHPITFESKEFTGKPNPIDVFLEEITESQEDVLLLKEIIGYCFYRDYPFQDIYAFVGKGNNGKSTLLNLIKNLIGEENISSVSFQQLAEDKFSASQLYQKNANLFGDLPNKAFKDSSLLKQLCGHDTITAQEKFVKPFKFVNYAKLIASCNEIPESVETNDGHYRRWTIVNFPNSFDGKENRNILDEICTEENKNLFFQSCIDSFMMAMDDGKFIRTETTEQKKEKYILYSNSPAYFCDNFLEYEPDSEVRVDTIYNMYCKMCVDRKIPKKDERQFFQKLYVYFNHKVFKKRKRDDSDFEKRFHVIVGVDLVEKK